MSAPLEVRKVNVAPAYRAMPAETRSMFLLLGMFINDANLLRKALVLAVTNISDSPDGMANFSLTVHHATTLAGKMYEGWERMRKTDFRVFLNDLALPDGLKSLRAELEQRLTAKLFVRLRNSPAFHYPKRVSFSKLDAHVEDSDLSIYGATTGYNGDLLAHIATLAGLEPLLELDPATDYRVALQHIWEEVSDVAGLYCIFVSEVIATVLLNYAPNEGLSHDTITTSDAPEAGEQSLRFFMHAPADLKRLESA